MAKFWVLRIEVSFSQTWYICSSQQQLSTITTVLFTARGHKMCNMKNVEAETNVQHKKKRKKKKQG